MTTRDRCRSHSPSLDDDYGRRAVASFGPSRSLVRRVAPAAFIPWDDGSVIAVGFNEAILSGAGRAG
jgi:hypothetical protein